MRRPVAYLLNKTMGNFLKIIGSVLTIYWQYWYKQTYGNMYINHSFKGISVHFPFLNLVYMFMIEYQRCRNRGG